MRDTTFDRKASQECWDWEINHVVYMPAMVSRDADGDVVEIWTNDKAPPKCMEKAIAVQYPSGKWMLCSVH